MSSLKTTISSITEVISTVVHIGAGYCTESELYTALDIESIILVESDAQLFEAATKKFLHAPQITVLQKAIAGKDENRIYFQLSNKRFSSLLEPGRIFEFYPNLKVAAEVSVDAISLESLCDGIRLPEKRNCLLVLELQGEEVDVLAFTPDHVFQNFKWIVVRCSKKTLYGEPSARYGASIKSSLNNANFEAFCFKEDNEIYCNYLFIRDDTVLTKQTLEKETEAALTEIESLTDSNLNLVSQVGELIKEKERLQAEVSTTLETLTTAQAELGSARDQVTSLSTEKEQLLVEVSTTMDTLTAAQTELGSAQDQVVNLSSVRDRQQEQIHDLTETLQSSQDELSEVQVQAQILTAETTKQKQRFEELAASHTERSDELKEANHALRINNKLVAKNDADLRDLQARYRTAISNQKQQHTLLLELQDKLIQASKFYRQLNIQDQNLKGDVFGDDIEGIETELTQNDND